MAISIIHAPDPFCFLGNPVTYILQSSEDPAETEIGIELWVEDTLDSGTFTKKFSGTAPVDASGLTNWELADLLQHYVNFAVPSIAATGVTAMPEPVVRWYIATFEVVDGTATSTTNQATHTSLKAGKAFTTWPDYELPADYLFLTTRPAVRSLSPDQRDWLCILPITSGSSNLVATINYTDGTSTTKNISIGSYTALRPIYVPIDFPTQDYQALAPAKTISHIAFRIGTGEIITCTIDYRASLHTRTLVYANSLGGFDTLHATGYASESQDVQSTTSEKVLQHDYNPTHGQLVSANAEANDTLEIRTGYKAQAEIKALRCVSMHRYAWLIEAAKLIPLLAQSGPWRWREDRPGLATATFIFNYAFSSSHYDRA